MSSSGDIPIIQENTTPILGTITVRRSMRIANQKRIDYDGMVIVGEKKISSKKTVRQESKKKRLQFEKSLFLPNNKKRKDVLKTFDKKSFILNKNSKKTPNDYLINSNDLNKQQSQNQSSYDSDNSSENSQQSDRSIPMKLNRFINKEQCNEESEGDEDTSASSKETSEEMSFPSYVAYRTKGNKLKLVQSKVGQKLPVLTIAKELRSNPVSEKPESTTKSIGSGTPSVSNYNSDKLKAQAPTSKPNSMCSPDTSIDLTQKPLSIEMPKLFRQSSSSSSARSQLEGIQFNKLLPQPVSVSSAINISPCLPSNSSNSMEFLLQSIPSNESTAFSPDCLETASVEPPNNTSDSVRTDQPTVVKTAYLLKATSPKPLGFIVSNEKLPIQFSPNTPQLLQDAEVQSSTSTRILQSANEASNKPSPNEVTVCVSTSSTDDIQQQANGQPSSHYEALNSLGQMQDISNFKRHFDAISHQRQQLVGEENTASTSLGRPSAEQQCMQGADNEEQATHGQRNPRDQFAAFQGVPNFEFNPQHYSSPSGASTNQEAATQQAETQPKTNNNETSDNPLARMQNMPNCNRYFTPFYLQRPVIYGAPDATPSTSRQPNAEQQQPMNMNVVSHERHLREHPKPSSSTQEIITNTSAHLYHSKTTTMQACGPNLQYSCPQAYNNQISAPQQTVTNTPTHASEHQTQRSNKPYTRTSKANQATPTEIPRPENLFPRSTGPSFNNHPYYSPASFPQSVSGFSTNQPRFPFFPPNQHQNNMQSNSVPNTSNFKQSPFSHPPNGNPNFYGYSSRDDPSIRPGNPYQSYNGQPYFPSGVNGPQNSSANQTGNRTETITQGSYNSRNFQPPHIVNNDIMRHHSNNQNPYWGQQLKPATESASHPPQSSSTGGGGGGVDPNKWLNDRYQQAIRPHHDKNARSTWLARPQEPVGPISTSPVDMDAWVRARMQQAAKPPELTNEQRISQLEVVVNSFKDFVHKFESYNNSLGDTATVVDTPSSASVAMQTSPPAAAVAPPWQTMTNNAPTMGGNIAMQPSPDPRTTWVEYNNFMATMQMEGHGHHTGYPYPRSNAVSQNSMRMEGNPPPPVNHCPVTQRIISHHMNAADSTTGGKSNNACLDLRSFRPTHQHYNQSHHPHNTPEAYRSQYIYFKTY